MANGYRGSYRFAKRRMPNLTAARSAYSRQWRGVAEPSSISVRAWCISSVQSRQSNVESTEGDIP